MDDYILIVDDNDDLAMLMELYLTNAGYKVQTASDAREALAILHKQLPMLVITDLRLPGDMDGFDLCRVIRQELGPAIPVVISSGRRDVDAVTWALSEVGADDYLRKPISMRELQARVEVLQRRAKPAPRKQENGQKSLHVGTLELDESTYKVRTPHKPEGIQLTEMEVRLLRYMMQHQGQVLGARQLLQDVWGYPQDMKLNPHLVRSHIRNLRAKVEDRPHSTHYIHTVHGVGYCLEDRPGRSS